MEAPLSELKRAIDDNQKKLVAYVQQNFDRLPPAIGLHGGTKESNQAWIASGGATVKPEGATEGNAKDPVTWVAAVTSKSNEAGGWIADVGMAFDSASAFADPRKWIAKEYTPGGVVVIDLSSEFNGKRSLLGDQFDRNPEPVLGLGQSEHYATGVLLSNTLRTAHLRA